MIAQRHGAASGKALLHICVGTKNVQIPITGNGHAITRIRISTHPGTCPYRYWDLYLEMRHHPHFLRFLATILCIYLLEPCPRRTCSGLFYLVVLVQLWTFLFFTPSPSLKGTVHMIMPSQTTMPFHFSSDSTLSKVCMICQRNHALMLSCTTKSSSPSWREGQSHGH